MMFQILMKESLQDRVLLEYDELKCSNFAVLASETAAF